MREFTPDEWLSIAEKDCDTTPRYKEIIISQPDADEIRWRYCRNRDYTQLVQTLLTKVDELITFDEMKVILGIRVTLTRQNVYHGIMNIRQYLPSEYEIITIKKEGYKVIKREA
jgi:hypothetical protein